MGARVAKGATSGQQRRAPSQQLLPSPTRSRPLQLGVTLFLLQQFAGINAIVYYSSAVFTQAGVANATVASAAVGLVNILGTVVAGSLVDRAGRKQLLSGSMAGMGTFMLLLAGDQGGAAMLAASRHTRPRSCCAHAFFLLIAHSFHVGACAPVHGGDPLPGWHPRLHPRLRAGMRAHPRPAQL